VTLIPILQKKVILGTAIITDKWNQCSYLKDVGFIHYNVNHSQNFIHSITGYNTQTIEYLWSILKLEILRKMHSTTLEMLHRHLIEVWYWSMNEKDRLLTTFLNDIKKVCCEF